MRKVLGIAEAKRCSGGKVGKFIANVAKGAGSKKEPNYAIAVARAKEKFGVRKTKKALKKMH